MHNLYSDSKSKDDFLHRLPFAAGIARNLVYSMPEQNESLVFGLNGRWGFGKSTLLEFVVNEIKELHLSRNDEKFEIFEFNPWMFSGQEQLLLSFYRALLKKIGKEESPIHKHSKKLSNWLENSTLGKVVSELPGIGEYTEKTKKGLRQLIGEGDLEDVKAKLSDALVKGGIRLYIIMDDLDRLTPDEITQVFQLVKLSANFKNTVFLLAYDKDIVVNAIEQKFKDNGERYLAKIVQVDYTLPEMLEEDIKSIFFKHIEDFFRKFNIPITHELTNLNFFWSIRGLKNYFRTLRDVYRYLNGLSFRLPEVWERVNIVHFLIVEAIRVFDFNGYQKLYFECFDWNRKHGSFPNFTDDVEWTKNNFPNQITRELLIYIRQKIDKRPLDSGITYRSDLFSTDAFEIYFALQKSKIDFERKDFDDFLANPETPWPQLLNIYSNGRIESLLKKLVSPEWIEGYPNGGTTLVAHLVNFFNGTISQDIRYKYFHLLEAIIETVSLVNQGKQENLNQLNQALELGHSTPQKINFLLLYNKWNSFGKVTKADADMSQQKTVEAISNYANRWINKMAEDFSTDVEIYYAKAMIETYAITSPELYEGMVISKFSTPEKLSWLLRQAIIFDANGNPIHWEGDTSPLFSSILVKQLKTTISKLIENNSYQQNKIFQFFLDSA